MSTTRRGPVPHYVNKAPFDPNVTEALTPEQERYYMATQWQLMWWKLRRHRLAVISGAVLAFMYFSVVISEILAPYALSTRNTDFIYAPPQGINLFHDGEFVGPFVARNPRAIEGMAMLAKAHASLGQHYDAIRYYERARIAMGEDTVDVLNPLATQYAAEGNVAKAREILARSLEIDADQPEIQRMLDQITPTEAPPAQ